jgi:hypothetical protein
MAPGRISLYLKRLASRLRPFIGVLIVVAFWPGTEGRSEIVREPPPIGEKVSTCALQADPGAYNHKVIEVRGVASHGFEDFTLSDPRCERGSGIWLEYGGRVNSETIYCCGVKSGKPRDTPLVVEGIATRLIDDALFRRFDARVRTRGDVRFRARLIGRFFAGLKQHTPKGDFWGGYGHLGCCSLLVIQQVLTVEENAEQGTSVMGGRPSYRGVP